MHSETGAKILRVDLTRSEIRKETLDPKTTSLFLGGPGLGAKILFDEVPPGVSAFDPANRLVFMTGPLTGTPTFLGQEVAYLFGTYDQGVHPPALTRYEYDALRHEFFMA